MKVLVLSLLLAAGAARAQVALGSYDVRLDETTVSGLSSGAYMAVQFGTAWSSIVRGVGAFAGGPYYCSQDSVSTATGTCQIGTPSLSPLFSATDSYAASGAIDPTGNLLRQKVWIFSGYNDGVVKRSVVDQLFNWYNHYDAAADIAYQTRLNAGHGQITLNYGNACGSTQSSFINNCGFDGAGMLLQHLFGRLNARQGGTLSGQLIQFDQTAFSSTDPYNLSMSHSGYAYVPASCAAGAHCRVHVAFHGCLQNADAVGSDYYAHAGYNEWADTNGLIVLYPQTIASSAGPTNPNGCWDWWGYNESGYATKNGSQIQMVRAMLTRLAAKYSGWSAAPGGSFGVPQGLVALDASSSRVALAWSPVGGAKSYNVYRASCGSCAYAKAGSVATPSASDSGLAASSTYFYKVRAVSTATGGESGDSAVVSRPTSAPQPYCDPYYRDNYTHTAEGRAYAYYGYAYAYGSNDSMGLWNIYSETNLIQTSSGYFAAATCP